MTPGSRAVLAASCLAVTAAACGSPPPAAPSGKSTDAPLPPAPKRLELHRPRVEGGAEPSPLLVEMRRELERSMRELSRHADPAPYYVSYQVVDRRTVTVVASFGALVASEEQRLRSLDVDVRVGDRRLDNTHPARGSDDWSRPFTLRADLPVEDEPAALRSVIWMTTDREYKQAVEDFIEVQTQRRIKVGEDDLSDDFSEEPPAVFHAPIAAMEVDRQQWEARVRGYSGLFRSHPEIPASAVQLEVVAETRFFVDTEGRSIQLPRHHAQIVVAAGMTARDGMELSRNESFEVPSVDALPGDAEVERAVQKVIRDVKALEAAPAIEPYAGPAILDGRAAGVFFHEIFGHRVEGHRQKKESEGQTFAKKVGQQVLPEFIDVYDDPRVAAVNGVFLNGHYAFDDEGVEAQNARLVERGVLTGFLMSRAPTRGFDRSNGHGRREPGHRVVARQANLLVDPAAVTSPEALKERLLSEVRRQGLPYGLRFSEITGGFTNTESGGPQAFKVIPVMVYKVHLDGREELVRGVDLEGTPLTALSTIMGAGNDFSVFNGACGAESGWVPVSATSPSLLVRQIEVARRQKGQDRPPLLPPPSLEASP